MIGAFGWWVYKLGSARLCSLFIVSSIYSLCSALVRFVVVSFCYFVFCCLGKNLLVIFHQCRQLYYLNIVTCIFVQVINKMCIMLFVVCIEMCFIFLK